MILPTIHPNGTNRQALHEGYRDAITALEAAITALVFTAPNGRDYYPQGPDAYRQAEREHVARIRALNDVVLDLHALAAHTG